MADKKKKNPPEEEVKKTVEEEEIDEEDMVDIYTLTDEDGNELNFMLEETAEIDGETYYAMVEVDENNEPVNDEYVILKIEKDPETGEDCLVSVDDDDEFDKVADYFDDLFNTIDYDAEVPEK